MKIGSDKLLMSRSLPLLSDGTNLLSAISEVEARAGDAEALSLIGHVASVKLTMVQAIVVAIMAKLIVKSFVTSPGLGISMGFAMILVAMEVPMLEAVVITLMAGIVSVA